MTVQNLLPVVCMLSLSLCFLAGVYTATLINVTSPLIPLAVFSGGLLLLALRATPCVAAYLAGLLYLFASAGDLISLRLPTEFSGDSLVLRVVIVDFPIESEESTRFLVRPHEHSRIQSKIRLNWYHAPVSVRIGDEWQLEVRLRPPRGLANPGAADTEALALSRGIGATGYVVNGARNRLLAVAPSTSLSGLRQALVTRIERALPDHPATPVLVALTVGSRHLFTQEHWRGFAASGTAHLLAISGLHIGLIAGIFTLLGRASLLFSRCNQRQWALGVGVIGGGGYLLLSGSGLPAQRAFIMLSVFAACLLLRRRLSVGAVLSFAAVLIVLMEPLSIMQPGLWLSFAAVASLFWWATREALCQQPKSGLQKLWTMQLLLFFALLPVTGLVFGRLSLSAPIANLFSVPVFSFITVPTTLLGVISSPVFDGLLKTAAFSVDLVAAAVGQLESLEPLVIPARNLCLLTFSALLFVCLPNGFPGRFSCLCAIPFLVYPGADRPDKHCFDASFFDIGQGTSILVRTRTHALLYDTGPPYGETGSAFQSFIAPTLDRLGVARLDRIVVSHADMDHAGGFGAAVRRYPNATVLVGEALAGAETWPCSMNQAWRWDGVLFQMIHPAPTSSPSGNDRSCVLRISAGDTTLLLTGDIGTDAEAELLGRTDLKADVVSMPHHGSRTSSSPAFITAVSPRYAVVSAGYDNRFGHPKTDVVRRWERQSVTVLNTSEAGAIRMRLCANQSPVIIGTAREGRQKLWHSRRSAAL